MPVLKKIFNPLSDTYLVMEEHPGLFGLKSYEVYRQSRSVDLLPPGLPKKIRPFGWLTQKQAEEEFAARLKDEKNSSIYSLLSGRYHGETSLMGCFCEAALYTWYGSDNVNYYLADPGAQRLYDFESAYFKKRPVDPVNLKQAKQLIRAVSAEYDFEISTFETHKHDIISPFNKKRFLGTAYTNEHPYRIRMQELPNGKLNKYIVLHELAHLVIDRHIPKAASHGPHFAMIATKLYDDYIGLDQKLYFGIANDPRYRIFGPEPKSPEAVFETVVSIVRPMYALDIFRYLMPAILEQTYSQAAPK